MTETVKVAVRPFSCGSQYADWTHRNCVRCAKHNPIEFDGACDIDGALGMALIGDGTVTQDIADRMGLADGMPEAYTWDCPERESKS